MNIQELIDQFEIQGAYCIKRYSEELNDYDLYIEGHDFEIEKDDLSEDYFNLKISCLYVANNMLHIELEME